MTQWEYKFVKSDDVNYPILLEDDCNDLGENGWELVNFQYTDDLLLMIFKREKRY